MSNTVMPEASTPGTPTSADQSSSLPQVNERPQQQQTTTMPSQSANGNGTIQSDTVDDFVMPTKEQIQAERGKIAKLERERADLAEKAQAFEIMKTAANRSPQAYEALRQSIKEEYNYDMGEYKAPSQYGNQFQQAPQQNVSQQSNTPIDVRTISEQVKNEMRAEAQAEHGWNEFVNEYPEMNHTIQDETKISEISKTFNQMLPIANALASSGYTPKEAYRRAYLALHPEKANQSASVINNVVSQNASNAAGVGVSSGTMPGSGVSIQPSDLAGIPQQYVSRYQEILRTRGKDAAERYKSNIGRGS